MPQAEATRGIRTLSKRDLSLLGMSLAAVIVALAACWFGVSRAQEEVLRHEANETARSWALYLSRHFPNLPDILGGKPLSDDAKAEIEAASDAGNIFRYKFFGPDGLIVHSSRPADIGQTNTKPYFRDLVRNGETYSKIERDEDFGAHRTVVSEAYAPIMENGEFAGAVEVYVDVTPRAARLARMGKIAFAALFVLLTFLSLAVGMLVLRHIRRTERMFAEVRRGQERLIEAREIAEKASRRNPSSLRRSATNFERP